MRDDGQTIGLYIVAMAAFFFLAFAYFAVGQASVARSSAQSAADAAALAAAREARDQLRDDLLSALDSGDQQALEAVLGASPQGVGTACKEARAFAADNNARVYACGPAHGSAFGFTVAVRSRKPVGKSVVGSTQTTFAKATATAVVEPRCVVGPKDGKRLGFVCADQHVTVDPTSADFRLDLSTFYAIHLSR